MTDSFGVASASAAEARTAELEGYRDELFKIAADVGEAADPFAAWEAIAAMKSALEPFSKVAERYDRVEHIRRQPALEAHLFDITIDHFRRARAALEGSGQILADANTNNPEPTP